MKLPDPSAVGRVSVIGAGTIGASWASYFLARGMDVRAWDPAPDAERSIRAFVSDVWPDLKELGVVATGATPARLSVHADVAAALEGTEFVQESAPEDLDVKRALYAEIDDSLPATAVVASSTSGLLMSELQAGFAKADRFVLGHPFNPPHLIPLVEVLGGNATDARAVDWAVAFYNAHGKRAVRLNREVPGHLVNRLQAALWQECADAVLSGLASVEDVDIAMKYGPGLRLGVMGPFELCHLAGGSGGYTHFMGHFGDALASWTGDLRQVEYTPDERARLTELVGAALGARETSSLASERDTLLLASLRTLASVRRERGFG